MSFARYHIPSRSHPVETGRAQTDSNLGLRGACADYCAQMRGRSPKEPKRRLTMRPVERIMASSPSSVAVALYEVDSNMIRMGALMVLT
jgi:hypothetical protein